MAETTTTEHAINLRAARKESLKNSAKKAASSLISGVSLLRYLDPFIDWLFGIALILAILKDLLDIINTALIAVGGIGEILIIIFTFFVSIFLFLILVITGSTGKVKMARNMIKRVLLIISTAIAEMIPAIGLLPMETILVIVAFWMTLAERKKGAEKSDK